MRAIVAVHLLMSPGGMVGPGFQVQPEIVDLAAVSQDGEVFSELVSPADQRVIAKLSALMDPADLVPGTVWGDLLVGGGAHLPTVLDRFMEWWTEQVGTDAYAGSARPVLVAHDAHVVRQRLNDHMPLIGELFSHQIDVTSLRAVTEPDVNVWEPRQWTRAENGAIDAWETYGSIAERMQAPIDA